MIQMLWKCQINFFWKLDAYVPVSLSSCRAEPSAQICPLRAFKEMVLVRSFHISRLFLWFRNGY